MELAQSLTSDGLRLTTALPSSTRSPRCPFALPCQAPVQAPAADRRRRPAGRARDGAGPDADQVPARLALRRPGRAVPGLQAKGYYKAAGLDVTIDAGNGSAAPSRAWRQRHLRHGLCRHGGADGVPRQQPRRAEQAGGGDDGLQQHAGRGAGAEEERHHQAGRPERQEAGRAGLRRRPPGLPDLRQGQRHQRRHLDQHGPAAARDHAGQGRRRRHHRLLVHRRC
jgi:hypothetical protein